MCLEKFWKNSILKLVLRAMTGLLWISCWNGSSGQTTSRLSSKVSINIVIHVCNTGNNLLQLGNESLLTEGLPLECRIACVCALSHFEEVCQRLERRDVSLVELRKMKENEKQVKRLCEAVTGSDKSQFSQELMLTSLSKRLEEFKHFSLRCQTYKEMRNWLANPNLPQKNIEGTEYSSSVIH